MKPLDIGMFGKPVKPNNRGSHLLYDPKIIAANGLPSFLLSINQGSKMLTTSVERYLFDSLAYVYDP